MDPDIKGKVISRIKKFRQGEKVMVVKECFTQRNTSGQRSKEDVATIGITDHAQKHLGELTFEGLPASAKK